MLAISSTQPPSELGRQGRYIADVEAGLDATNVIGLRCCFQESLAPDVGRPRGPNEACSFIAQPLIDLRRGQTALLGKAEAILVHVKLLARFCFERTGRIPRSTLSRGRCWGSPR
jgi:hypothetical protein